MTSICEICHSNISAHILFDSGVWLSKTCHICETTKVTLIEPSESFFRKATSVPSGLYPGLLIDVTTKCNLSCKYCYHERQGGDADPDDIFRYAVKHQNLAQFILTGGEPTIHPDIVKIYRDVSCLAPTIMLTNGTNTIPVFEQIKDIITINGTVLIGLSMHKESKGADIEVLEYAKRNGLILQSVLCVVDTPEEVPETLARLEPYRQNIETIRIKAATNTGATANAPRKLYVSELLTAAFAFTRDIGHFYEQPGIHRYFNARVDDGHVAFMTWPDTSDIILEDLRCGPYWRCKDNKLYNIAESLVRNSLQSL